MTVSVRPEAGGEGEAAEPPWKSGASGASSPSNRASLADADFRAAIIKYNAKTKLAPKAKEALTVTIDGARAKAGALEEQIAVTSKDDPSANGTIGVRAVIK